MDKDDLYDEAARIVVQSGQASISYLQRRLRIGFSRAARLVDMMEMEGLVSPAAGGKPREVLVDKRLLRRGRRAAAMTDRARRQALDGRARWRWRSSRCMARAGARRADAADAVRRRRWRSEQAVRAALAATPTPPTTVLEACARVGRRLRGDRAALSGQRLQRQRAVAGGASRRSTRSARSGEAAATRRRRFVCSQLLADGVSDEHAWCKHGARAADADCRTPLPAPAAGCTGRGPTAASPWRRRPSRPSGAIRRDGRCPDAVRDHDRARRRGAVPRRAHRRTRRACSSTSRHARGRRAARSDAALRRRRDIVRQVRLGRHPNSTTRVVLDAAGVVELQRLPALQPVPAGHRLRPRTGAASRAAAAAASRRRPRRVDSRRCPQRRRPRSRRRGGAGTAADARRPARATACGHRTPPTHRGARPPALAAAPSRRVRAGHQRIGARRCPPGTSAADSRWRGSSGSACRASSSIRATAATTRARRARASTEAELVLDVALRLEKLLQQVPGIEVDPDAPDRRLRPAAGAHGDRQPRGRRPVPLDSRQRQRRTRGPRRRDLLPQFRHQP